jgi:acetyl esterase/lipase
MPNYAPGLKEFIDRCNAAMPPDFYKLPNDQKRAMYLGLTVEFPYPVPAGVTVENVSVQHRGRSVPARVYRPAKRVDDALLVYIRGGGFVVGSLDTHNTVVAELCDKTGLVAVAADFRMAPEHPFPAALEDCFDVVCGIASRPGPLEIDPKKIVISGDSSGANMAAVVAMMIRDRGVGPALRGQALISPVLDFTRWRSGGVDAPLLTGGEMEYYTACYSPNPEQIGHEYVSPLVSGHFDRLPPAYIMGAEMDSLLVDSQKYADHLKQNGTAVKLVVEPGLVHSAVRARGLSPAVADAWKRFCAAAAKLARTGEV